MNREMATLGGGCFWCLEAVFERIRGVESVVSGYCGGHVPHPTYRQVCEGTTGHAEVVQLTFQPQIVTYRSLLEVFFAIHDPTTRNRQGHDVGPQYRSVIFYHSPEQQRIATELVVELDQAKVWAAPIVTEIVPYTTFYPAEEYHQGYFRRNPSQAYCQVVIAPKLAKFHERFAALERS
ncbi:MAG: peptide-methionine (S)-S-oxide reductase MsrA [Gemmataceae bacterium]|nr:peptide-methionine (S)-S-oxide reductase MsrA [Gemmataceae bacterium]MDW8263779.1 peptide-methionine (S)-S-oxide reductase MsrA [Gemmataceae bacterium]